MPSTPIPAGAALLVWEFQLGGTSDPMMCTLGVDQDEPIAPGTAPQVYDAWANSVLGQQDNTTILTRAVIYVTGGLLEDDTRATAGGVLGNALPPNTAYLVKKLTGLPGRHNRGRVYVPGVSENSVGDDGYVLEAQVDELNVQFQALYDELVALGMTPAILHADGGATTSISRFQATSVVATQRRRLHR